MYTTRSVALLDIWDSDFLWARYLLFPVEHKLNICFVIVLFNNDIPFPQVIVTATLY